MSHIKTALSIEEYIFLEIDQLAKTLHISRSELFTRAAKYFLESQKNLKILKDLNEVYKTPLSKEEVNFQKRALKKSFEVIDQW
jgi:metal-responsive CopG/Arc/MetJ family transcriptional regulator